MAVLFLQEQSFVRNAKRVLHVVYSCLVVVVIAVVVCFIDWIGVILHQNIAQIRLQH